MMNTKNITGILIGIMALIVLLNLYSTITIHALTEDLKEETTELERPAEIQIITITDTNCADCFITSTIVDAIKNANVEVTSEEEIEYTEDTAKTLIEKYNIEKIPTVIVTGEINKEGSRHL